MDLAWPFLLRSGLLLIVFGLAFRAMHDLGFDRRRLSVSALPAEMRLVTQTSMAYGWQRASVRLLMMTSFFQLGFLSWAFYAWQPYFLDLLGSNAVWVAGLIAALISLGTIPLGYVVGGLTILGMLPALGSLRGLGQPADVIVGTAGHKSSCAAQGLPSVTSIDTVLAEPSDVTS